MMLSIRSEVSTDISAIRRVHTLAFGRPNEADLVDALRHHGTLTLSLVAMRGQLVVGHIAFSPVAIVANASTIKTIGLAPMAVRARPGAQWPEWPTIKTIGLAPMAVLPEYQRQGVGSQLVQTGLATCGDMGYGVVVVLGHPHFYPKFGFTASKPHGIEWEYEVPEEVFMVKELQQGTLALTRGVVKYGPEFNEV